MDKKRIDEIKQAEIEKQKQGQKAQRAGTTESVQGTGRIAA